MRKIWSFNYFGACRVWNIKGSGNQTRITQNHGRTEVQRYIRLTSIRRVHVKSVCSVPLILWMVKFCLFVWHMSNFCFHSLALNCPSCLHLSLKETQLLRDFTLEILILSISKFLNICLLPSLEYGWLISLFQLLLLYFLISFLCQTEKMGNSLPWKRVLVRLELNTNTRV